METAEKKAADRQSVINAALASAVAAAGIGAVVKDYKARRRRAKKLDVEGSHNAITVDVNRRRFMRGVKTPEELAAERGETGPQSAAAPAEPAKDLTPDEIVARKRAVIGGRRFDFFGKRAADADGDAAIEPKAEGRETREERVFLRGEDGRFVSPTDPVAVEKADSDGKDGGDAGDGEKKADWVSDTILHPIDSLATVGKSAIGQPVAVSAGLVGSVILAAKIAGVVNARRRKSARRQADEARDDYARLVSEKSASGDPRETVGRFIGGTFFIPMALSALVVNRVLEHRLEEKKRAKEMSSSYPDEPVILYKTSEDRTIRIDPETALFALLVKRAMVESAEESAMRKEAQAFGTAIHAVRNGIDKLLRAIGDSSGLRDDLAFDQTIGLMQNHDLNDYVLRFVKARQAGQAMNLAADEMSALLGRLPNAQKVAYMRYMADPARRAALLDRVATSKQLQDLIVRRAQDPDYAASWGKYRDERIADALEGNWGLKRDSWLHKIVAWLANVTGLGQRFFGNGVREDFAARRAAAQKCKRPAEAQNGQKATGQPAPQPAVRTGLSATSARPSGGQGGNGQRSVA